MCYAISLADEDGSGISLLHTASHCDLLILGQKTVLFALCAIFQEKSLSP